MFLSIVVPVYNVELYLNKCLESILACELKSYELILINDGSTDNSYNICLDFQQKYTEIKVLSQENKGLSNARNVGLNEARGEYIVFIDSDDYIISKSFYETIEEIKKNKNQKIDILISDFFRVSKEERIVSKINQIQESDEIIYGIKYMESFLKGYGCFWNTWRFVFCREFLIANKFKFKDGFLCEDIDFAVKTLLKTNNIAFYHNPYYCYKLGRESSIMNIVSEKRVRDYLIITEECMQLLRNNDEVIFSSRMKEKLLIEYVLNLTTIFEVDKTNRKTIKNLFKQTQYLFSMTKSNKIKCYNFIISLFGISSVAFVLLLLKKMRRIMRLWRTVIAEKENIMKKF
ncbi:hypothetical protein LF65_05301 [Clostridium beijerinckii]|uniref:Glycosyltransferase 2-like domain-containing protein n=1 Tax=Clostridium beijerinckii TaxID=1520 RepID=A0A0B5QV24_CLOBE|nr:glycosyltransferase [Clostridium beijerinckii]AJH01823.1 hypothetical protein LF65_05301 [Clostridium beijerinckii]